MFSILTIHYNYLKHIFITHAQVIKHFFTYVGSALVIRGIALFTLPFTLYTLAPADYAKLAMINSFISVIAIIYGLGLRQALSLEYFHHEKLARIHLTNQIIRIYLIYALPTTLILIACGNVLNNYFFMNQLTVQVIAVSIVIIFMYFLVELLYQLLQYEQQASRYTFLQTTSTLLTSALTIFFLRCHYNFASSIYAQAWSILIILTIGSWWYKNYLYINLPMSLPFIHKNLIFHGLPFIPTLLCSWVLASANRWILAQYMPLNAVGMYALSDTAVQLFQLCILTPWAGSYLPHILSLYKTHESSILAIEQHNLRIMYTVMVLFFFLLISSYQLFTYILQYVLPPLYHDAIIHLWFSLIAQTFLLGTYFASSFLQFHKKSYFLACSLCVPAATTIILNYILVPCFGLYGCSYASICSYGAYFCITMWYNWQLREKIAKHSLNHSPV